VKRSYYNLYASLKAEEVLARTARSSKTSRRSPARASHRRRPAGCHSAGLLISELDRELANNQQGIAAARSALARQLHIAPETDLKTLPELPLTAVPRKSSDSIPSPWPPDPSSRGASPRLPRDQKTIELARKRFYPNVTLGLTYMDMEKTNAQSPSTASGSPNVGLFVVSTCRSTRRSTAPECAKPRSAPAPIQSSTRLSATNLQRDPGIHGAGQGPAECPGALA